MVTREKRLDDAIRFQLRMNMEEDQLISNLVSQGFEEEEIRAQLKSTKSDFRLTGIVGFVLLVVGVLVLSAIFG